MKKSISILGSTGSVGRNALDVVDRFPGKFNIYGLACRSDIKSLLRQIRKYRPKAVAVLDRSKADEIKCLTRKAGTKVYSGVDGLAKICSTDDVDLIVGALAGTDSLFPFLEAVKKGKDLALANKEVIVAFGSVLMKEARKKKVKVIPVDSELSAIFQCLCANDTREVEKIILTASGGPFYNLSRDKLKRVTADDAVRHPVWKMGKKISVDSATMMNKGLEIIETSNFFDIPADKIEVLIHPQAMVHSIVTFVDGASLAQLAVPDMRIPIQYALFFPRRIRSSFPPLKLTGRGGLQFFKPRTGLFPCLKYARTALEEGGCMPAVMSSGDEVAVDAFLNGEIGFTDIPRVIRLTMDGYQRKGRNPAGLSNLIKAAGWAGKKAAEITSRIKRQKEIPPK